MVKRLTEIYKTEDGNFFESEREAEAYEEILLLTKVVNKALHEAKYHDFGMCTDYSQYAKQLVRELVKAGFKLH